MDEPTPRSQLLTVGEVMSLLRVSRATVYRLWRDGEIRGVRVRGVLRWEAESIDRYVRRQAMRDGRTDET